MAAFLIHLLYIAAISQSLTGCEGNQAPVSCEVCAVTDPDCVKGGARTVCDVTQQYCLTEVTDTLAGNRTVGRKCADVTECEQKFAVTEERLFCYEVDMGNLRADVTCSFCCQGDLCNQGPDLIPPAQFLYNGDLSVTGPSTLSVSPSKTAAMTSSVINSPTPGLSTVPIGNQAPVSCEVCDITDPDCFHGGTPTSCDDDHSFCMTTVHDNFPSNMTVSRSCVNESVCYQKWYMETSWRHYCYDIDQGELYFPVDCNFCCVGDLCNAGPNLVPPPETLYQPNIVPTVSGTTPSSVDISEASSTTSNSLTVPTQTYPHGSTTDRLTESTPTSPQEISTSSRPKPSTDGPTSSSSSNPQGSSTDYFTGPSLSGPQGSSTDGSTSPKGSNTDPAGSGTSLESSRVTHVTLPTTVSTTEKPSICEVCNESDPECFTSGKPTRCDPEESYCMTTVHDNYPSNMTVSRGCVNESVCYQKWYMETSWRHYCYDIDQGDLHFPVECNFCCVGDLCNSGTLVPNPDTLYRPPPVTTEGNTVPTPSSSPNTATAPFSTDTSMTTPSTTSVPTTEKQTICEVCEESDPECFTSGTPTRCDLEESYCMTTVHDNYPSNMTVSRGCVNESVCYQKWYMETSWRHYCYDVDQGDLHFTVDCNFCCVGDLCNSGALVPNPDTLYRPPPVTTEGNTVPTPSSSPNTATTSFLTDTSMTTPSTTSVPTAEKHTICEMCDESDPECFTSGTPTRCDLEESYCMTTVHDNYPSNMTVSKGCVNESVCYQKWYMETSWRHYCYDIDQGDLYFPVDCNFCCVGDLCNSGTLIPNPDTLYRPPEPTNVTDVSTSSETQDTSTTTVPTTPHVAVCDVCSRDDLGCDRGGRPTLCDPDRPYCQVTVYEDNRFTQYAERSCADLDTCMKDWVDHTSGRPYCFEVDEGPLFYPNYCSFCCVGDQCNNGSLVPSSETLYYPIVNPSTPQPMSTAHPDITETTVDGTQTTSEVTHSSTQSTTIHYPTCDTCSSDDPNCMTRGQPTTCDIDTPFCMTSVIEDMTSTQTARRMCVNETVCQVEWLQKTSSKFYCYRVDQGPLYFANTCSFCCIGDLCNSGTLVPDTHKLYALPPATGPTATDWVSPTP